MATQTTTADPFALLGLPRDPELERAVLDARYLELSRACHPDYHAGADADARLDALQRSAALNDAYRALRDDWERARCLVEIGAPGAMERTKQLCPAFLMAAIELAEEIDGATPAGHDALLRRLRRTVADYRAEVVALLRAARYDDAATKLHEARYYRRAIARLTHLD